MKQTLTASQRQVDGESLLISQMWLKPAARTPQIVLQVETHKTIEMHFGSI